MDRELISASKFLSLVLRHQPETIGISLDDQGWVEIDELLANANRSGRKLTRPLLERVVRENDKQRFAISPDGKQIRASQGHSVESIWAYIRSSLRSCYTTGPSQDLWIPSGRQG
jgi:putative RNA 2'-phosphotransferase